MVWLRLVHRWIGLTLAVVVLAVAASGGLLLLRDPYYRIAYPALATPVTEDEVAKRAAILTDIESRGKADGIRLIKFPRSGVNAFQVWYSDGSEAFVDPRSGEPIDRWHWHTRLPAFLFELHAHLMVDTVGTVVNGIAALFMIFMALTGTVLWWPRRRGAFRVRHALPRRTAPGELLRSHAAVGALAAAPILLFAATGAAIVFYEPTAQMASALLDARPPDQPSARVAPQEAPRRSWVDILAALDRTFPEGEIVFYYPGSTSNARLMFRKRLPGEWHPNGRSHVLVDPYTAVVVQASDARTQGVGTRVMHAVYPVHAAKVGGSLMVSLAAGAATALCWLATGGAWVYLGRRRSRGVKASKG